MNKEDELVIQCQKDTTTEQPKYGGREEAFVKAILLSFLRQY